MAYELFISPADGDVSTVTPASVVEAFTRAGVSCVEQPDQFGHWLVLSGYESALDLTVQNGVVTGAGFRFVSEDDDTVIQKVADVFKSIGWEVGDDEGLL